MGVQAAAPQMHPKLFAVVPSVSEQRRPVVQRQLRDDEHLVAEYAPRVLKMRRPLYVEHPGGGDEDVETCASVKDKPRLTAAASHSAWVPISKLPVSDSHDSLSIFE